MRVTANVQLTEREETFVLGVAYGLAPTAAAYQSGHSKSTYRLLMARPHIRAALHDLAANATACLDKWQRRQARQAGYSAKGAASAGNNLLNTPKVADAIDALRRGRRG